MKIWEKLYNIFSRCFYRNIVLLFLILIYFNYIKFRYKNIVTNSDYCNMVLEANDIIHGNFFLNDWHLTGLTFITTDLPYYMLSTAVFGISIRSYVYASALMFVVFIISCYLLIKDKLPENKLYIVLFICIACIPSEFALDVMRLHTADVALSLVGLYIIYNNSINHITLTFSSCVLAWFFFTLAVTGDSVCIPFVIVPALCISFINIIRNYVNSLEINKDDIKISIIALLSIVAGKLFEELYFVLGNANKNAYLGTKKFIALEDIYTKLALYLQSMLKLFNADFTGAEILSPKVVCCFLGTIIVTISLYSVIWNIWNYLKGRKYDRIALTLSLGFVLISVLCIITNIYVDLGSTRYYATALGILCVILIRTYSVNIKSCLSDMKSRRMTVILSLFLLVFSCHQFLPLPENNYKMDSSLLSLLNVLKANNLKQGYSEFWTASSATVYSNNSIKIRALTRTNNKLAQFKWFCKNDWFNEESHFVVVNKNGKGVFFTKGDVEKHLGKPDKILLSEPYLIYVYDNNITGLYPIYNLGTEIVASNTDKNNVYKYVKYGLSFAENEFTWTDGSEMAIGFWLNSSTEKIHGQIDIGGVYTGKQRIIIYANNVIVFDSVVESNQKRIDFYFDNPGQKKTVDIVFKFPDSDSPFNRGESKDSRLLSLAIKSMKFGECN